MIRLGDERHPPDPSRTKHLRRKSGVFISGARLLLGPDHLSRDAFRFENRGHYTRHHVASGARAAGCQDRDRRAVAVQPGGIAASKIRPDIGRRLRL